MRTEGNGGCVWVVLMAFLGLPPLGARTVEEPLPSTLHDEVVVTANRVEEMVKPSFSSSP